MKLNRFLGVYNEGNRKIVSLFGLKIKLKRKSFEEELINVFNNKINTLHRDLNRNIQKNLSIYHQHQKAFANYKNINYRKDVVLIATEPTLNNFVDENISSKAIRVGCNKAFMRRDITLDYLFMQDYEACKDFINDVPDYVSPICNLFYGFTWEYRKDRQKVIPDSIAIKHGATRYYTDWAAIKGFKPEFTYDIATQPLCCWGTIAFPAMQFILWTNPKRVYLVGCDCSIGHFDESSLKEDALNMEYLVKRWKELKRFVLCYYPETEIISVNPVGLKGLFRDVYTESYLAEHPEIRKNLGDNIEILKSEV